MPRILRLENQVQHYDWGSKSAIPMLLGLRNFEELPWAEYWMGAHPKSPSSVHHELEGTQPLDDLVREQGDEILGARVRRKLGDDFPFLFKVLAADRPLSLQAHPDRQQAEAGFAAENEAKIPLDDPQRNFRDPHPKPELLVALTPFQALKGFRKPAEIIELLDAHQLASLKPLRERLAAQPDSQGLQEFVADILRLENFNTAINEACTRRVPWVEELAAHYPDEAAALCPLFLQVITLAPGEGIYLGPRELHAYLKGTALEIMGNSDNVLRAGLSSKHVDLPALLSLLDFETEAQGVLHGEKAGAETRWKTPAAEFELTRIALPPRSEPLVKSSFGPRIFLVIDGTFVLTDRATGEELCVTRGDSALLPDSVRDWEIEGRGTAFVASVPQG